METACHGHVTSRFGTGGGILVANGADAAQLSELTSAGRTNQRHIEIVAPAAGVKTSDG
jgi:hypothetical protein